MTLVEEVLKVCLQFLGITANSKFNSSLVAKQLLKLFITSLNHERGLIIDLLTYNVKERDSNGWHRLWANIPKLFETTLYTL